MKIEIIFKENERIIEQIQKFTFKRDKFKDLLNLIDHNKSVLLSGLRQIGKSTLMKQSLSHYKDKAVYINISQKNSPEEIEELINNLDYKYNKEIIFIDEIQNIPNWGSWIIDIYNNHSGLTFVLSGSASIKVGDTSGSIRFRELKLNPLSLKEYIEFTNEKLKGIELLNKYIGKNAITGMTNEKNLSHQYIKNQYFDTYVYNDIFKYEKNIVISEMHSFLEILKTNTSGEISKTNIIKQIWKEDNITNKRKLENIINVLIKYNVIYKLERRNLDNSIIRNNKLYINPHLFLILMQKNFLSLPDEYKGYVVEGLLIDYLFKNNIPYYIKQSTNAKKYANKEIDLVVENVWYEIKATKNVKNIEKSLNKMFIEYNQKDLIKKIISFADHKQIKVIPNLNIIDLLLSQ